MTYNKAFDNASGVISGAKTITLDIPSNGQTLFSILNDSQDYDLQVKFHTDQDYAVLGPGEAMDIEALGASVILDSPTGSHVAYRVMGAIKCK